jgi:hypothetical protein
LAEVLAAEHVPIFILFTSAFCQLQKQHSREQYNEKHRTETGLFYQFNFLSTQIYPPKILMDSDERKFKSKVESAEKNQIKKLRTDILET